MPSQEKEIESDGDDEGESSRAECANTFSGPLDKTFRSINAYSADGHKYPTMLDALMFMIVKDNMPLRTPQKEGFRLFCKKLQPLYKPPSPITITEADQVCLTSDLWTHKYTMQSYLGITAHYLVDFDIKSVELGAYPMDERKTIDNIRCVLRETCSNWGLTDEKFLQSFRTEAIELNVQNIAPPVFEASIDEDLFDTEDLSQNLEHAPLRNLIRKVKAIVRFFKQSEIASKLFKNIQIQGGNKECLKLIQEVPTRWNSCYEMLDRFISLADHVGRVLLQIQIEKTS
ncbi:Zinc finger BED domain-containing protein DAYSLEEPER [Lucilia cuprina]|nr:Zinc finger BED domain-containing protein DAYSLEEPER [Lucilia cuprina]